MEVWLGDYAGEKLETFGIHGDAHDSCSQNCLGKYLKGQGLHLSRCTFYLMTKEKFKNISSSISFHSEVCSEGETSSSKLSGMDSEESLKTKSFSGTHLVPIDSSGVVMEKQTISIQYSRESSSKYNSDKSLIKCHSISQCQNLPNEYVDNDVNENYYHLFKKCYCS